MPLYEFINPDGAIVEKFYVSTACPDIGQWVIIDGVKCQRIISTSIQAEPPFRPYITRQVQKNYPGYECDDQGRVRVRSRQEEQKLAQEAGLIHAKGEIKHRKDEARGKQRQQRRTA